MVSGLALGLWPGISAVGERPLHNPSVPKITTSDEAYDAFVEAYGHIPVQPTTVEEVEKDGVLDGWDIRDADGVSLALVTRDGTVTLA